MTFEEALLHEFIEDTWSTSYLNARFKDRIILSIECALALRDSFRIEDVAFMAEEIDLTHLTDEAQIQLRMGANLPSISSVAEKVRQFELASGKTHTYLT